MRRLTYGKRRRFAGDCYGCNRGREPCVPVSPSAALPFLSSGSFPLSFGLPLVVRRSACLRYAPGIGLRQSPVSLSPVSPGSVFLLTRRRRTHCQGGSPFSVWSESDPLAKDDGRSVVQNRSVPSGRFTRSFRHCERGEATQGPARNPGLLRHARNNVDGDRSAEWRSGINAIGDAGLQVIDLRQPAAFSPWQASPARCNTSQMTGLVVDGAYRRWMT